MLCFCWLFSCFALFLFLCCIVYRRFFFNFDQWKVWYANVIWLHIFTVRKLKRALDCLHQHKISIWIMSLVFFKSQWTTTWRFFHWNKTFYTIDFNAQSRKIKTHWKWFRERLRTYCALNWSKVVFLACDAML